MQRGHQDQLDKNQYFSSIINHENTAYSLISGGMRPAAFHPKRGRDYLSLFQGKDLIGGVPFFYPTKGQPRLIHSPIASVLLYPKNRVHSIQNSFSVLERKIKEEAGNRPDWISEGRNRPAFYGGNPPMYILRRRIIRRGVSAGL